MEEKRFFIRISSPVHVGCDEVYDPTGFVINENAHTLTAFDPMDYFRNLNDPDKKLYAEICRKGTIESILELYKFMKGKQSYGHTVGTCRGLIEQYQKTISIAVNDKRRIQQELNNFSIARTAFNPVTQKPYIPGSAIKGAFRTAYLNYLAETKKVTVDRQERNPANALEKSLLEYKNLENDPFRLLKISDFYPVGPCKTKIVYAVNAKKVPSRFSARGPYQILEIIEPGSIFAGTIQVFEPLSRDVVKTPLSEEKVFSSAKKFYQKEKKREDAELSTAGLPVLTLGLNGDLCLLRIGRHSGAESITIEGHRRIKIMKKRGDRPDFLDKATTFWLASDVSDSSKLETIKPFGWITLGVITEAFNQKLEVLIAEQAASPAEPSAAFKTESSPRREKVEVKPIIQEEIWEEAYVSFEAGKGGIITATAPGGKKAQLIGREKTVAVTDEALRKKLFEGKKTLPKARVTILKTGSACEIISIKP